MLGLLGTVSGMIVTFKDLALTSSRQVLSQGLSEALWTTEVGLLAALPLLATHHLLSRLQSRWMDRLEFCVALLFQTPEPKRRGKSLPASPGLKHRARAGAKNRAAGHEA
jgi:biopolymer transport protein ExbB